MWLSYEIKGKKIEFEIVSEYQEKGNEIDQDSILAGVLYEIGCKWEKE